MERTIGRVGPPADDGRRHPLRRRRLRQLPRRVVAGGGTARRQPRDLRALHRRADARPEHHGPARCAAGIHQVDLGLSRSPGRATIASRADANSWRNTRRSSPRSERAYGVDRHILAAIWGVESNYGTMGGDRPVVRSTATLACVGRRRDYFREEFLSTLEILARGDVKPDRLIGSWAGAFGPTQFMPTTFKRYAVDFDGDGRRDVVDSVPDLIASTANNLKNDGWVPGESWGYEVVLPPGFNYLLADRAKQMTVAQWEGARRQARGRQAVPTAVRARPICCCRPAPADRPF